MQLSMIGIFRSVRFNWTRVGPGKKKVITNQVLTRLIRYSKCSPATVARPNFENRLRAGKHCESIIFCAPNMVVGLTTSRSFSNESKKLEEIPRFSEFSGLIGEESVKNRWCFSCIERKRRKTNLQHRTNPDYILENYFQSAQRKDGNYSWYYRWGDFELWCRGVSSFEERIWYVEVGKNVWTRMAQLLTALWSILISFRCPFAISTIDSRLPRFS